MNILSLGWGVQSFALAAMAALGDLPRLDYAIHADTTHERSTTYEIAHTWTPWLTQHGITVVTVQTPHPDILRANGVAIPAYLKPRGMLPRQCTRDWKVYPIRTAIRQAIGPGWRIKQTNLWIGISLDEIERTRPSDVHYIVNTYPLLDLKMTRDDCKTWLTAHSLPIPAKSTCCFCPYQTAQDWRNLTPHDWTKATAVDTAIRHATHRQAIYLRKDCRPLADPTPPAPNQLSLWQDECTGFCNT